MAMTSTFFCTSMEQTFSISERAGCIDGPTSSSKSNASCCFTIKFNCGNEKQMGFHGKIIKIEVNPKIRIRGGGECKRVLRNEGKPVPCFEPWVEKAERERESERQREKLVEEGALLICKLLLRSSSVFPLQN